MKKQCNFFVLCMLGILFFTHTLVNAKEKIIMENKNIKEIYFAGGCFWGVEKLFSRITGVINAESGYANGKNEIVPTYQKVIQGDTEYRETVHVVYDQEKVHLEQLLKAYFYVIDPTLAKQQGNDIGDQYQTGIYYVDEDSEKIIKHYVEIEAKKHKKFLVEITPLKNFFLAEEYHQDYLDKNPQGYCHISRQIFQDINMIIQDENSNKSDEKKYIKPSESELRKKLSSLQYDVTQNAATERAFTGEYWDFNEKGIYVDITTGEPLFTSYDKFPSSCGWASFKAPIHKKHIQYKEDTSYGMKRVEVKSNSGNAHLGHVFYGESENPNGVRYCINSASIKFIPYEKMKELGYEDLLSLFD